MPQTTNFRVYWALLSKCVIKSSVFRLNLNHRVETNLSLPQNPIYQNYTISKKRFGTKLLFLE
mgnify:CR=1 FL=1